MLYPFTGRFTRPSRVKYNRSGRSNSSDASSRTIPSYAQLAHTKIILFLKLFIQIGSNVFPLSVNSFQVSNHPIHHRSGKLPSIFHPKTNNSRQTLSSAPLHLFPTQPYSAYMTHSSTCPAYLSASAFLASHHLSFSELLPWCQRESAQLSRLV
jgi:hypothetical protein